MTLREMEKPPLGFQLRKDISELLWWNKLVEHGWEKGYELLYELLYEIIGIILLRGGGDSDQVVAVKCEGMVVFSIVLKAEPTRFLSGLNPRCKKKQRNQE